MNNTSLLNDKKDKSLQEELIGAPALLEQLAEEAAELTKAALKMARLIRKENPTPKTYDECYNELIEEYSDVFVAARALNLEPSEDIMNFKAQRWERRLNGLE